MNEEFLLIIKKSFLKSLETGPRSNEKLKILHGFIADKIKNLLGKEYEVKSLGINDGRESKITGRYMDKNVDITILKKRKPIAGIAVKFVMSNYSQNSNNYFENMLGETANLRANKIPYFQIFLLPERLPYYKKNGDISKWEHITENNLSKYIKISLDNVDSFFHTPNKTFFGLLDFGNFNQTPETSAEFEQYYKTNPFNVKFSRNNIQFDNQTIYNDFEDFLTKVHFQIKSL